MKHVLSPASKEQNKASILGEGSRDSSFSLTFRRIEPCESVYLIHSSKKLCYQAPDSYWDLPAFSIRRDVLLPIKAIEVEASNWLTTQMHIIPIVNALGHERVRHLH